jgi:hypothetical protein
MQHSPSEKLTGFQLVKKSLPPLPHFMEFECSLLHSQVPATCSYLIIIIMNIIVYIGKIGVYFCSEVSTDRLHKYKQNCVIRLLRFNHRFGDVGYYI